MKKNLRHGYTTGACAAAASKGAALMLRDQCRVDEVTIELPAGVSATFSLHGQTFSATSASCFIIKDAGDDPDITNGAEVHAAISLTGTPVESQNIYITGGTGIGKATKPGLAVAPGEWAINPVPRQMIARAVQEIYPHPSILIPHVVISIPDGEVRALKTLNSRLGIIGGLSILGTTGIVRPISAKAWTDTIDAALDVARACGCPTVVFSTGRTSELAAQKHMPAALPEEAYVMMGDHVAHALRAAHQRGFMRPVIACQFAKLVKIACGYENTHAAASDMDLSRLRSWAEADFFSAETLQLISRANTAREIAVSTDFNAQLIAMTVRMAEKAVCSHAPGTSPSFLVANYDNQIIFDSTTVK